MSAEGFPPAERRDACALVLGTLPGPESLRQRQYYAQSRNTFRRIMGTLVGAGPELPYPRRLGVLIEQLRLVGEREGFLAARVVRVFIALLAKRYTIEIGRPQARGISEEAFRQGAHGMLKQIPGSMLAWRVEVAV